MTPTSAIRSAFADAAALLLPVWCAGCGEPGSGVCAGCRRAFAPAVSLRTLPDGLRVYIGLVYDGAAARAITALKEGGRTDVARAFAPAMRGAFAAAARSAARPLVAVTVPTSRQAFRRRGYRVPDLLAERAGVPSRGALRWRRRVADQRALGREERLRNVSGALGERRGLTRIAGAVVLVDDVVTTGATLMEARRALGEAGIDVAAAVALAGATPGPSRSR